MSEYVWVILEFNGNCLLDQNDEALVFETEEEAREFIQDYTAEEDHGLVAHQTDEDL